MKKETNPLKVVTGTHRVSYVHVKEPSAFKDEPPAYNCTLLIPKDHKDVERINAAMKAAYAASKESLFKGLPFTSPKINNPLKDGDEYADEREAKGEMSAGTEAYRGHYYLKASSKSQPAAFDADKQELLDLDEVYSGCYCRAVIVAAAYNFEKVNPGLKFYLNAVMKMKEGERLGGFETSADDFDDEEDLT